MFVPKVKLEESDWFANKGLLGWPNKPELVNGARG